MIKFNLKKIYLILFFYLFTSSAYSNNNFFNEGVNLFNSKNIKESKIKFEKDIVFNPKSEKSYLYLAKIFKKKKKLLLQENSLNTVLLLNPKNEEAIYLLALLSIERSNFSKTKILIENLDSFCVSFCSKVDELEKELENSLK